MWQEALVAISQVHCGVLCQLEVRKDGLADTQPIGTLVIALVKYIEEAMSVVSRKLTFPLTH